MKIKFITFIILLIPSVLFAAEVEKEQWIKGMEIALPAAFCNQKTYFRQCFSIDAMACEEVAASVVRICLDKYRNDIPIKLTQPQDGKKWGNTIGTCAGEAFEKVLIKKRINSKECNDINNWK